MRHVAKGDLLCRRGLNVYPRHLGAVQKCTVTWQCIVNVVLVLLFVYGQGKHLLINA